MAEILGTDTNDILPDTLLDDVVTAGGGDDSVMITRGRDQANGGAGTDTLVINWGDTAQDCFIFAGMATSYIDTHNGPESSLRKVSVIGFEITQAWTGSGMDKLEGGAFGDFLSAGLGRDSLYGYGGRDTLYGEGGRDLLFGGSGKDLLIGGAGRDKMQGDAGDDVLRGNAGHDRLLGDAGSDRLNGGSGQDWVDYSASRDGVTVNLTLGTGIGGDADGDIISKIEKVKGTAYDDYVIGNLSHNRLLGENGNDVLIGMKRGDELFGGAGNDRLEGRGGWDAMHGADGNDVLVGGRSNDNLWGGAGNDQLIGGNGFDYMKGGPGNDTMTGGKRSDHFDVDGGLDVITDFENDIDTIHLRTEPLGIKGFSIAEALGLAQVVAGDVVFDFGAGDTLTLLGYTGIETLHDDLALI